MQNLVAENGKRLENELTCPICDGKLMVQEVQQEMAVDYETCRGELFAVAAMPMIGISAICEKCRGHLTISGSCGKIESVHLSTEPNEPLEWEELIVAIKSVRYARLRNLGNYENEWFEAEVEIEEGKTADDAAAEARRFVNKRLGLTPSETEVAEAHAVLGEAGGL